MSSVYVREKIITFFQTEIPGENLIDLTADYEVLEDLLAYNDLGPSENWVGIQFVGSEEVPVDIRATNNKGTYREIGVFYLHVVAVATLGGHNAILARAEAIRNIFRGQRIDLVLIQDVSPPNFGNGISLNFSGGYTAATIIIDYQRDLNL